MSITTTLFPPAYRMAALVAFLRTFWQVIRPPLVLGSLSLGAIAATGKVHLDLRVLGIIALAALLSALASGLLAAGDILKNGLPDAYLNAAGAATVPASVTNIFQPTTPTSPSAPAAGVPPTAAPSTPPAAPAVVPPPIAVQPTAAPPFVATPVTADPAAVAASIAADTAVTFSA